MRSIRGILGILDLKHKKSLRLGLLSLSTLFIISESALVYASMIYEKALSVGNTSGTITGSGSTASAEVSIAPVTIMILAVASLVIGLSMFGFIREASKHISNFPGGLGSSPTGPVAMSHGAPGIGLPSHLNSMQEDEWEESPTKDEGEE